MKKITLFLIAMLAVSTLSMAKSKLYVYQIDGSRTEFLADNVDFIAIGEDSDLPDYDVNANGHQYVDLGLPSGNLWATCNVGANTPEEAGDYFAWGETEVKDAYHYGTYKWYNLSASKYTKYCIRAEYGEIDNRTIIELLDDAANVNWGGNWRLPSREDMIELQENCTWEFTSIKNVPGYKIKSKVNLNSIFLPAVGYYKGSEKVEDGLYGYYRTSSLSDYQSLAFYLYFNSDAVSRTESLARCFGMTIRPVLSKNFSYEIKFDGNGATGVGTMPTTLVQYAELFNIPNNNFSKQGCEFIGWNTKPDGTGVAYKKQDAFSVVSSLTLYAQWYKSETNVTHEYVDLGLSVKWATCNIGASKPEDSGYYFAWGETKPKEIYDLTTHKWCNGTYNSYTKYCTESKNGTVDNKVTLESLDDAANVNWGGNWRMPSQEELNELLTQCTWRWQTQNGVNGYTVTGPSGNSIFLPAVGTKNGSEVKSSGFSCEYWSRTVRKYASYLAYYLDLSSNRREVGDTYRYIGCPIRPVLP
jgi:hypothetical protein